MSDVQRFEQIDVYEPGGADMRECAEGDWVHYDDYKALASRLSSALLLIQTVHNHWSDGKEHDGWDFEANHPDMWKQLMEPKP